MLNFILMTLSFTVAIMLAAVIGCVIISQPPVMKMYLKWVNKTTKKMLDDNMLDEFI